MSTPAPGDVRWFVCHCKPRCEKKFAALLAAEKFEHYLPLIESLKRYGTQTKRFTKPLFPGYVFAQLVLENKPRIYQQDLLARVIPVTDESLFLRQMSDVRTIVASGLELSLRPLIHKGTRVRVTGGPLWGLIGIVDDPTNPKGIIVAVDVLQQGLHVLMSLENLEPLP
ncbi:MAG: antitermination protein NusG [Opitutaceae bacterium]|nr:antitermination protein NusG [Opitutaceae bacterium]